MMSALSAATQLSSRSELLDSIYLKDSKLSLSHGPMAVSMLLITLTVDTCKL